MRLPAFDPTRELRAHQPEEAWIRLGAALFARHGLDAGPIERFSAGTAVVLGAGAHVLKLSAPVYAADLEREAHYAGCALSVALPRVVATGEHDGWPYVVMTRVGGLGLDAVWPTLGPVDRVALAGRLGALVREIQALPAHAGSAAEWPAFLAARRRAAEGRHGEPFGPGPVAAALASSPRDADGPLVVCHTELLGDHVRVEERADGWHPAGLIDWAEARAAPAGYEVGALVEFVFQDALGCLAAFARAAGIEGDAADGLAWYLLHEYGRLPRLLGRLPDPPSSLAELARRCFDR